MSAEYVVELLNSDASFGPNVKQAELWDIRNLGWSRYDRVPGKAFFTINQNSGLLGFLVPLTTHVRIYRLTPSATTLVYSGVFVDYDTTGDDIVCTCFDYLALLSISRSGYKTLYPKKKLGTEIVSPEWNAAKTATSSPLAFVTTGAIEDPLGTDAVTVITTNLQFGTLDQMRLQLFYDLSEMGRANTIYEVTFAISRDTPHTFTFQKNVGSSVGLGFVLNGNVSDYRYMPNWAKYRNDLATIGTTSGGGATEVLVKDDAAAAAKGRRQDVFTLKTLLGIVGLATEADQQAAASQRLLKKSLNLQPTLLLQLERDSFDPYVGHDICDKPYVEVGNGIDSLTGQWRLSGYRGMFTETGEDLSVIVEPVAV
jgi:hypothetical protein